MTLTATDRALLDTLKTLLQEKNRERDFERLAAALISRLLDVPIYISNTGFQYGGDAGPAGAGGRRFRLECKKYSDTTALSERDLLGEIDQALARDEALEGWFLVATRAVKEQLAQSLEQHGDRHGVPVIIIDWSGPCLPPLAVLCMAFPDIVETIFSKAAADAARTISASFSDALAQLRRTCQEWCLGFQAIQNASHKIIREIWNDRAISQASLNQDVAGGAITKKVSRTTVDRALTQWWQRQSKDEPAVMVGYDGVGKTWAMLGWIVANLPTLPITIVIPSSAMADFGSPSALSILRVLGARMTEVTGVRDVNYWSRRARKLLERPPVEGATLTIVFDGMNQEASLLWSQILKILQAPPFAGRVRVLASTRTHHFGNKLSSLNGLVVAPHKILVEPYSIEQDGELDQMLAFEGLTRADLNEDLLELARTPRLFKLVVRLRDRLANVKEITVHRLLWEYGRDSFGERAGRSFSEGEWLEWLQELASHVRGGINEFSQKTLAEMAGRADLTKAEVTARLSDILDSRFSHFTETGYVTLQPAMVAHALGLALVAYLEKSAGQEFAAMETQLNSWLDPIAGMDQRAEVLRAAVTIEIERNRASSRPILGPLVTAWLQTQNLTDEHRNELLVLAGNVVSGLLDAIQFSTASSHASARHWAAKAIRGLPKTPGAAFDEIVTRCATWTSVVSMEMYPHMMEDQSYQDNRRKRFQERVGTFVPGPITVLGVPMNLEEVGDETLAKLVPTLLDGYPLLPAVKCFEAAAITLAIRGHSDAWKGLKWLCQLNEIDPAEVAAALRALGASLAARTPEPAVLETLGRRAAGLALCLSGVETDEEQCGALTPIADGMFNYQGYLDNPGRSFFMMERRHADQVLGDSSLPIHTRIQKCHLMLYDPTFSPPAVFVTDLRAFAKEFPVDKTWRQSSYTMEDRLFEELEPALARWAPDLFATLIGRFFEGISSADPGSRYWIAGRVEAYFLHTGAAASAACVALRTGGQENDASNENFVANELLVLELKGLPTLDQIRRIIAADITWISVAIGKVLGIPTAEEIDQLIEEYQGGTDRQKHDLMLVLSFHPETLTEKGWAWFQEQLQVADDDLRGIIFRFLTLSDGVRFGRILLDGNWSWSPGESLWMNHFGSLALMAAGLGLPFDQLAPRLAPWLLFKATHLRGADKTEVQLAADILGTIIEDSRIDEPDPGSDLVFRRNDEVPTPFYVDIELRPRSKDAADPAIKLRQLLDQDSRIEDWNRAIKVAHERIEEARSKGANLYLTDLDAVDMRPVVQFAKERVSRWLEGMEERTVEFKKRVRLSEGAFMALCEAMLDLDSKRGVELWQALRTCMTTRYMGDAEIPDLVHMIFRAQDNADVLVARAQLFDEACTDKELFELVTAARFNGKPTAIDSMQISDADSSFVWRQRRGQILAGLTGIPAHFDNSIWPSGVISTTSAQIRQDAGYLSFRESAASHWFGEFLDANDATQAFAAWSLFKGVTDRRALIWMHEEIAKRDQSTPLYREKLAHIYVNRNALKRAMGKHEEKADRKFLGQDIFPGVGPWRSALDFDA